MNLIKNYRHYNFQAFAGKKFPELLNLQEIYNPVAAATHVVVVVVHGN